MGWHMISLPSDHILEGPNLRRLEDHRPGTQGGPGRDLPENIQGTPRDLTEFTRIWYDLIGNWLGTRDAMIKLRIMVIPFHCNPSISHGTYVLIVPLWCGFNQIRSPIVNSTHQWLSCLCTLMNSKCNHLPYQFHFQVCSSTINIFTIWSTSEFSITAGEVHAHDDSLGSFHLA